MEGKENYSELYVLEKLKELEQINNELHGYFNNNVRIVQLDSENQEIVFHIKISEYRGYARNMMPIIPTSLFNMLSGFAKEQVIDLSNMINDLNEKEAIHREKEREKQRKKDRIAELKKELEELENE